MPLWLSDLLADPSLGLALVAGEPGLHTRGPVRWAHSSELPDPTPWLEGGEVLLTTGLGVRDAPELQRKLIAGLDQIGCAGVGFGLGVVLDKVPPAMLDESEQRQLPLFTVPYEVPFIAVTKRISHHVAAEHYATLRSAVDLHRQVLASVIAGHGVAGVLQTVARQLPDHACLVFDYYGQVLAAEGFSATGGLTAESVWTAITGTKAGDRFEVTSAGRVVVGAPVRVGDEVEALFALVGDRPLLEHESLLLEQGLAGVGLELARGISVREAHRARVDDAVDEVVTGRARGADARRLLERAGLDATRTFRVVALTRPGGVSQRALCSLAEDVLAANGPPVVGRHDGSVVALVQPADSDAPDQIATTARERGWRLTVGCSRPQRDADALPAALREALVAAASGVVGVSDVGGLGVAGLLAGLDHGHGAEAFVDTVLAPVIAHDERESTALVATLAAYLRHGCRPGPAAQELRIHRHTLSYRLDRVRDLTGRDPRDGAHLLEFGLALELHARSGR